MLKTLVILIAILIAVVNVSAQTRGPAKRPYIARKPIALRIGPPTTYLKAGFTAEEVVRLLGAPTSVYNGENEGVAVKTYEFQRGGNRVLIAEFVKGALRSSRTEVRQVAPAGR